MGRDRPDASELSEGAPASARDTAAAAVEQNRRDADSARAAAGWITPGAICVLEIGTGSGYQTALISLLAETVYTIERVRALSESARKVLESAGYRNIQYIIGDGTLGWRPGAPYDAILVSAASPDIPQPLVEQLAPGGRMIVPVGDREVQALVVVRLGPNGIETSTIGDARFVPLIGQHGWR